MEQSPASTIILEKKEGVATITFNRPEKRNSLSVEMQQDIISSMEAMARDGSIAVVVTSGGDATAYCAGADVRGVVNHLAAGAGPPPAQPAPAAAKTPDIYEFIRNYPKLTIASINGYCVGGGLALALCHDLIIASEEKAVFGLPEILLNLIPGRPASYLFRYIPQKWATDLALTGDNWDARTALQRGIVSRTVPHAELPKAAFELARRMARLDPITLKYAKKSIHAIMDQSTASGAIETGSLLFKEHNRVNPDAGKGAKKFLARN